MLVLEREGVNLGLRVADRRRSIGHAPLRFALVIGVFLSACATTPSPPTPAASASAPASRPIETPPSATVTAAPVPIATPSSTASPTGSIGSTPTIVRTVDATVHLDSIPPALSSVAFVDVATGWAAGSGVILGTSDGGKSWRPEWTGTRSISSLSAVDRLHAWGLGYGDLSVTADQLVRTTDGGRSWTMTKLPGGFREIAFATDRVGWAVVGGITDTTAGHGRLWETVDGGLHWRSSALTAGVDSVCFASPGLGWAAGGSNIYRTVDGGGRWTIVAHGPSDAIEAAWFATIRCRGNGAWVLSTGGGAGGSEAYLVTRTLDAGARWQTVLGQLGGAAGAVSTIDAYAGSFDAASASAAGFIGFCPACGYGDWSYTRTADGGRTFTHTPLAGLTGASLGDLTFADPAHGWIAGGAAGGFLLATTDGGRTWHRAYPFSAPWPALDIALVSPSVGFGLGVIGDGRAILRTDDGGRTWQAIGRLPVDPGARDRDPILSFVDPEHGWVATATGVLVTTDGGHTWRSVPGAPPGGVAFADAEHGCAGSFDTPAAMTTDGGQTWAPVDAGRGVVACAARLLDPAWVRAAQPFDPGNLLTIGAVVDATHAWALGSLDADRIGLESTTDGGTTWTAYRWPPPPDGTGGTVSDTLVRVSFATPTAGWVFTLSGRLFETRDGGASWHEVQTR
jgi:photosystem II stability/assembly factor-like uncharacterized protein